MGKTLENAPREGVRRRVSQDCRPRAPLPCDSARSHVLEAGPPSTLGAAARPPAAGGVEQGRLRSTPTIRDPLETEALPGCSGAAQGETGGFCLGRGGGRPAAASTPLHGPTPRGGDGRDMSREEGRKPKREDGRGDTRIGSAWTRSRESGRDASPPSPWLRLEGGKEGIGDRTPSSFLKRKYRFRYAIDTT